jgi:nucleotide-binding universal stress UspA family protein
MADELIAAIDGSAAGRPVLVAAREIARLFGDELYALHVAEDHVGRTVSDLAASLDVPLRTRRGEPVPQILAAVASGDVRGVVLGSRGLPTSPRAIGGTALALIQTLEIPVVVVPPTATIVPGRLHRLLVPLDGSGETAAAVERVLDRLVTGADLDVVALHVFETDAIPAFSDQPGYETESWTQEFLRRWLPGGRRNITVETRVGRAPDLVREVARDVDADVIALGWKQDLGHGRAAVVSSLLADCDLPVVLVPVEVPKD